MSLVSANEFGPRACLSLVDLEAWVRIELTMIGFADRCLTTWLPRRSRIGGDRTPDLRFWRPLLYQLSYYPRIEESRLVLRPGGFQAKGILIDPYPVS